MKKTNFIILLAFSILFTSCSLTFEKRHYRKGYHVEVINNQRRNQSRDENARIVETINPQLIEVQDIKPVFNQQSLPSVELSKKDNNVSVKQNKNTSKEFIWQFKHSDCDVITLKNGSEIEASIVKISDTEIEYKKCNNTDGPSYVIKSSEVLLIKLKNGENYIPKGNSEDSNDRTKPRTEGTSPTVNILSIAFGVLGLILGILGWVLPVYGAFVRLLMLFLFGLFSGITSIVLGAKGQRKALKGLGLAGIILGSLVTIACIVGLVFLFILFF